VRAALATLPWVEKDTISTSTAKQEATFGFKRKEDFKLEDVKAAVEKNPKYTVSRVVNGPTEPQKKK
jgi:hypothetical protein